MTGVSLDFWRSDCNNNTIMSLKTFTIRVTLLLCLSVAISSANPLDQTRNKRFVDLANVFGGSRGGGGSGLGPLGFIQSVLAGKLGGKLLLKKIDHLLGLGKHKIKLIKKLSNGNLFGGAAAGGATFQPSGVLSFLGKRR